MPGHIPTIVNVTQNHPSYSAVPTRDDPSPNSSPDLGVDNAFDRESFLQPAPSLMTHDSTRDSLLSAGPGSRSSWGSAAALDRAAAQPAGRAPFSRGPSQLGNASPDWNNPTRDRLSVSDEDEEPGHIAPAAGAAGAGAGAATVMNEKPAWAQASERPRKYRKCLWLGIALGALLVVGLAVGLGVGITQGVKKSSGNSNASADQSGSSTTNSEGSSATGTATATSSASTPTATSGGQGSLITFEDGTTMTYDNPFGGVWVEDPSNPFNNEAQAQSYTPPLNQNWTWGVDKIYGVNVGGWLVTEPFIVPGLYEKYASGAGGTAVDEFTLSLNIGSNLTNVMTEHYDTFITERDFAEMACAGINWVRVPIGHWAVATTDEESYLERVSWTYVLKAIRWARKYGLRINFDLHAVPGSQNGWNHSGKLGAINWLNSTMGIANAQRSLEVIRTLAEFISQPEYAPVIPLFGFINEPNANALGQSVVGSFYHEAHNMIREITGYGEGNGPMLSFHDGFIGIRSWYTFLPGADRLAVDQHPYLIFGDQPTGGLSAIKKLPCQVWASQTNDTSKTYGVNIAGEWSAAPNDCGKWVNSVNGGSRYDGSMSGYESKALGSCDYWNDYTQWNQSTIDDLLHMTRASMDALQNFFFWTWKIGDSTGPITKVNPFWHYRLGLENGWVPKDPRSAAGTCAADGFGGDDFSGTYSSAYMTGGQGAGTIAAAASSSYPWPPASLTTVASASMSLMPQYTQTGTPVTMPGPSYTKPGSTETFDAGSGWFNAADTRKAFVPIDGCTYPPEYSAGVQPTAGMCGAGLEQTIVQPTRRDAIPEPIAILPTAAPRR